MCCERLRGLQDIAPSSPVLSNGSDPSPPLTNFTSSSKRSHDPVTRHLLTLCPTDTSAKTITSQSKPTAFPSKLRDKLSGDIQAVDESAKDNEQLANESCEKCGGNEVRFHTVQLRSADEGSTVFYTCHTCGHKYAPPRRCSRKRSY